MEELYSKEVLKWERDYIKLLEQELSLAYYEIDQLKKNPNKPVEPDTSIADYKTKRLAELATRKRIRKQCKGVRKVWK